MKRDYQTLGGAATPVFYPSVSSVSKNKWSVIDHIKFLVSSNHPQFLISCFDAYNLNKDKRFHEAMMKAKEQYQTVLWDSGIYEVVWSRSRRWCKHRYAKTLRRNSVSYSFSYDANQKSSVKELVKTIKKFSAQVESHILPIVHCPDLDRYPEYCQKLSSECNPKLIAIPERELGHGVIEIAKNIRAVRNALKRQKVYQNLHILGTGNPITMMLYSFAGANSFDGLDWCQTVVDYKTATLHHPLHLDLYKHQSSWEDDVIKFPASCYMHNLEFYEKWMRSLEEAITTNKELDMLRQYLKESIIEEYYSEVLAG